MCNAIFDCAYQLFGLKFVKREDIEAYHPDVDVYEVREEVDGKEKLVAIFLHDNFARPMKNGGAWMSDYRGQTKNPSSLKLDGFKERVTMKPGDFSVPIIVNNNNFAKGADGEPTLLSFDDARTLFHEFGHGLHGMLSNVNYRRISGTSVLKVHNGTFQSQPAFFSSSYIYMYMSYCFLMEKIHVVLCYV